MTIFRIRPILSSTLLASCAFVVLAIATSAPSPAQPAATEPIAYIGHGGMFDAQGKEILPTAEFIAQAQGWYLQRLVELTGKQRGSAAKAASTKLFDDIPFAGQDRLLAQQALLERILDSAQAQKNVARTRKNGARAQKDDTQIPQLDPRLPGKLRLLGLQLQWVLPKAGQRDVSWREKTFVPSAQLQEWLKVRKVGSFGGGPQFLVTNNTGQAYINECQANQVPIPPSINQLDPAGLTGWKIEGLIPQGQQFIIATPAQLRSFKNDDGVCIALPRYTGSNLATVFLDGVICQSKVTSKVCFWDNQRATPPSSGNGVDFTFSSTTIVPIGIPTTPGGLYQGGGKEIEFGTGGVCTDCHAGENPYIVHPDAVIRPGYTFGDLSDDLPLFAPDRYDPIVGASWAQNALSHSPALVPPECSSCHFQGFAGRLPHLSTDIPGFCGTVLRGAVTGVVPMLGPRPPTMPQGSPGSFNGTAGWTAFNAYCGTAPSAGPSNRGDPHLITSNDVSYDFQAAGEFTALKNSGSDFELQTRQTPVVTSFVPGANAYTGLQSCVSLNTAVAVKLGKRRVTFQPPDKGQDDPRYKGRMVLRIDGRPSGLPAAGVDLGGGNRIARAGTDGSIDVRGSDGSRVIVTPNFWSSQGYWYLNVEVLDSPAREGTMGPILGGSWLPVAPNGVGWGGRPGPLIDRHVALNQKFADAWRVTDATSLFDYAPGTSSATFTDRDWPSKPGGMCSSTSAIPLIPAPGRPPIKPIDGERAKALCRKVQRDPVAFDQCVFDVAIMGDPAVVSAYARTVSKRSLP